MFAAAALASKYAPPIQTYPAAEWRSETTVGMIVATMVWSRAATKRARPKASRVAATLRRALGVGSSERLVLSSEGAGWYASWVVVAAAAAAAAAPETVQVRWASWMSSIVMFGVSSLLEAVLCSWSVGGDVWCMVMVMSRFADDSF